MQSRCFNQRKVVFRIHTKNDKDLNEIFDKIKALLGQYGNEEESVQHRIIFQVIFSHWKNRYAGPLENVNPVFREVWSGGGVRGSAPIAAQGTWVCWAPAEPIRAHPQSPWMTTHPVADPSALSDPPPALP